MKDSACSALPPLVPRLIKQHSLNKLSACVSALAILITSSPVCLALDDSSTYMMVPVPQIQALQARHTQELEALQSEVQQLTLSRRTTEANLQTELESAQGEAAAHVETLKARIEELENDNYDVITCITQEAEKVSDESSDETILCMRALGCGG